MVQMNAFRKMKQERLLHIILQGNKSESIGQKVRERFITKCVALHPWPIAYTTFKGDNVKIWWAKVGDSQVTARPGEVVKIEKDYFEVATGEGTLAILELQPAGKKRMSAEDYLRGVGSKLQIGDLFE